MPALKHQKLEQKCHIISSQKTKILGEQTFVYQTHHEKFIVVVQQKQYNKKDEWNTLEHCLLPEIIVWFMAKLSEKQTIDTHGGTIFTSASLFYLKSRRICPHAIFLIYVETEKRYSTIWYHSLKIKLV